MTEPAPHPAVGTAVDTAVDTLVDTRTAPTRRVGRAALVDAGIIAAAWLYASVRIVRYGLGLDDVAYATPAQQVTLHAWASGRMALWSNTTFGGTPHLGNLQTAALYPGHLLSAPFPDLVGPHIELSLHLLLFGVGCYALGRSLGFARPAPAAMAVAAMWSGATVFRAPLLVHFPPLAWVPLAAVCVHAVVTAERPRRAMGALAITLWCILVSGHPQSVLMALTLLGAWSVGVLVEHRAWHRATWLAASAALTVVMSAPVLMALRGSIAAAAVNARDEAALLNPEYVVTLSSAPRLLLGRPLGDLSALAVDAERITYAGVAVVALGIVGVVAAIHARRWSLIALAIVGTFAATLSLGPRSPSMQFARAVLPGFDQPRVSARWNWVLVMALIVLAGAGIDRLRTGTHRAGGAAVLAGGAALVVLVTVGAQGGGAGNDLLWVATAGMVVTISFTTRHLVRVGAAGLLVALAVLELGLPMTRLIIAGNADITDTSQLIGTTERWLAQQQGLTLQLINGDLDGRYVVPGLRPNANTLAGVRSIDGYDGGVAISRRWHAAVQQIVPTVDDSVFGAQLPAALDPAAFARIGVHFVLYDPARGPAELSLPGWVLRPGTGYFQVYENPRWQGDVTAWYTTQRVAGPTEASEALRTARSRYEHIGLVEADDLVRSCTGICTADHFLSSSAWSGQRSVEVQLDRQAVVAFYEQFDEGWTATIDGKEAAVVPVDGVWAAVAVPAGRHRIELRYSPDWLIPAMVLMLLAWLAVAALCCWPMRRR